MIITIVIIIIIIVIIIMTIISFLISIVSRPGLVKRMWENYTPRVVKNTIQQTAPSSFHS